MNGDYSSVENARAQDPEADKMRYRNYITIVESNLITARREQEAINWEMNRRYGRSKELRVVIDSWRDVDDQLWRPNTLIPINIPIFGLEDKQWLLSEVVFIRGSDGTKAILTLMPQKPLLLSHTSSIKRLGCDDEPDFKRHQNAYRNDDWLRQNHIVRRWR